jgi:hypothetical protein
MVVQQNMNRAGPVNDGISSNSSRGRTGEIRRETRPKANSPRSTGLASGRMPDGDPPDLTLWGSDEWGDSSTA